MNERKDMLPNQGCADHKRPVSDCRHCAHADHVRLYMTETTNLVAVAFGADLGCVGCDKTIRHADRREYGTQCLGHGSASPLANAERAARKSAETERDTLLAERAELRAAILEFLDEWEAAEDGERIIQLRDKIRLLARTEESKP